MTLADGFNADIVVSKDGNSAPGTSIMSLMMLAAGIGDSITITAEGAEADAAVDALGELVANRFGEE